MADSDQLDASMQLAIRKQVSTYLIGIISIFGVANVIALFGALYFLVGEAARRAVTEEVADLGVKELVANTLIDLGEARVQIRQLNQDAARLTEETSALRSNMDTVLTSDAELIAQAAKFLQLAQSNADFSRVADKLDVRIETSDGTTQRIVSGRTCAAETKWQVCESACGGLKPRAGVLDVSIADAGFVDVPAIYVSQAGSGSWTTNGTHAIYNSTPTSFRIYAYNDQLRETYASYANRQNHCVSWLAIGN